MSYVVLPSRRTRQPQGAVSANPQWYPSALWAFSSPVDVVSGRVATLTSDATFKGQASGLALSVAGTAALDRAILNANAAASDFGGNDFTVLVRFVLRSTRESYVAFGRWFSGGTASQCMWYIGGAFNSTTCNMGVAAGTGARGVEITGLTWAVGNEYTIIGRRAGTSLWVDRINHTTGLRSSSAPYSDAAITTLNSVSARNLKLGEFDAGAAYNMDLDASVAAILPYKASDAQVRELYDNPWQLVAPDSRRIYFGASGGGATIITASGAASLVARAAAAVAATKTAAAASRATIAGTASTTSIRTSALVAKARSAGAAATTTLRTATIAARTVGAGTAATITLRTGLAAGRLTSNAQTTYAAIIAGAFTAAGRTSARGTAAYASTHTATAAATATTSGAAAATTLREGIAVARVDARAAVTAAALVAGTVTTSAAAQISARASVSNTTERSAALAAMLALRGANPAAPELPVIVPPSTRTLSPDHTRLGLSPVAPAKPRLG